MVFMSGQFVHGETAHLTKISPVFSSGLSWVAGQPGPIFHQTLLVQSWIVGSHIFITGETNTRRAILFGPGCFFVLQTGTF